MKRSEISGPEGAFTRAERQAGYALLHRRDPALAAKGLSDPECLDAWADAIVDAISEAPA